MYLPSLMWRPKEIQPTLDWCKCTTQRMSQIRQPQSLIYREIALPSIHRNISAAIDIDIQTGHSISHEGGLSSHVTLGA